MSIKDMPMGGNVKIFTMTKIPPKVGVRSPMNRVGKPFYDTTKGHDTITDITKEMFENYWGASMLRNVGFEVVRVFSIPNGERDNQETIIKTVRAACKGKLAALVTDTTLKIALEKEEDSVLLKMFLG
jgi:hypothetical protein